MSRMHNTSFFYLAQTSDNFGGIFQIFEVGDPVNNLVG